MREDSSGVYIVSRRAAKRSYGGRRRGAVGVLVTVLLLLTAGICALVVILPRLDGAGGGEASAPAFSGKSYYMLATCETDGYAEAAVAAQDASARGGAGYIYNNGKYHVVAAVYSREADAKTLASVNPDSHYFEVWLSPTALTDAETAALEYLVGDWFDAVYTAATELDRGNATDAAADYAVMRACAELSRYAEPCGERLRRTLQAASEYDTVRSRSTLSYIRYITVRAIDLIIRNEQ